jgi:hypothetical protein
MTAWKVDKAVGNGGEEATCAQGCETYRPPVVNRVNFLKEPSIGRTEHKPAWRRESNVIVIDWNSAEEGGGSARYAESRAANRTTATAPITALLQRIGTTGEGYLPAWPSRRAEQNAPELLPDYEASVGSMLKVLRNLQRRSEGDPQKISDVIVELANSDEVPVRPADPRCRCGKASAASGSSADKRGREMATSHCFNGF